MTTTGPYKQLPVLDQALLVAAQLRATGANIHDVKEAIGSYKNEYVLGNQYGWDAAHRDRFEKAEAQLRRTVAGNQVRA